MLQKRILQRPLLTTLIAASIVILSFSTVYAQGGSGTPTAMPNCPHSNSVMGNQGGMMGSMMNQQMSPEQCTQMGNMMGMMGGQSGMGDMMGGKNGLQVGPGTGMMGQWIPPAKLQPSADKPLTLNTATKVAEAFIAAWKTERQLKLGELMQFSNQFYGSALETENEHGAFEFLIDPKTGTVFSEPGPNMMWNLRYGMTMGLPQKTDDPITLTVTPSKAREYAQVFLDKNFPSTKADDKLTTFYGYYTLEIMKQDKPIGMLSVNGFTGQVWYHHWHGDFVSENS